MKLSYPNDCIQDLQDMIEANDPLILSIKKEGIVKPLLVSSTGWIIKGRRRYIAAKALGIKDDDIPIKIV